MAKYKGSTGDLEDSMAGGSLEGGSRSIIYPYDALQQHVDNGHGQINGSYRGGAGKKIRGKFLAPDKINTRSFMEEIEDNLLEIQKTAPMATISTENIQSAKESLSTDPGNLSPEQTLGMQMVYEWLETGERRAIERVNLNVGGKKGETIFTNVTYRVAQNEVKEVQFEAVDFLRRLGITYGGVQTLNNRPEINQKSDFTINKFWRVFMGMQVNGQDYPLAKMHRQVEARVFEQRQPDQIMATMMAQALLVEAVSATPEMVAGDKLELTKTVVNDFAKKDTKNNYRALTELMAKIRSGNPIDLKVEIQTEADTESIEEMLIEFTAKNKTFKISLDQLAMSIAANDKQAEIKYTTDGSGKMTWNGILLDSEANIRLALEMLTVDNKALKTGKLEMETVVKEPKAVEVPAVIAVAALTSPQLLAGLLTIGQERLSQASIEMNLATYEMLKQEKFEIQHFQNAYMCLWNAISGGKEVVVKVVQDQHNSSNAAIFIEVGADKQNIKLIALSTAMKKAGLPVKIVTNQDETRTITWGDKDPIVMDPTNPESIAKGLKMLSADGKTLKVKLQPADNQKTEKSGKSTGVIRLQEDALGEGGRGIAVPLTRALNEFLKGDKPLVVQVCRTSSDWKGAQLVLDGENVLRRPTNLVNLLKLIGIRKSECSPSTKTHEEIKAFLSGLQTESGLKFDRVEIVDVTFDNQTA